MILLCSFQQRPPGSLYQAARASNAGKHRVTSPSNFYMANSLIVSTLEPGEGEYLSTLDGRASINKNL